MVTNYENKLCIIKIFITLFLVKKLHIIKFIFILFIYGFIKEILKIIMKSLERVYYYQKTPIGILISMLYYIYKNNICELKMNTYYVRFIIIQTLRLFKEYLPERLIVMLGIGADGILPYVMPYSIVFYRAICDIKWIYDEVTR